MVGVIIEYMICALMALETVRPIEAAEVVLAPTVPCSPHPRQKLLAAIRVLVALLSSHRPTEVGSLPCARLRGNLHGERNAVLVAIVKQNVDRMPAGGLELQAVEV